LSRIPDIKGVEFDDCRQRHLAAGDRAPPATLRASPMAKPNLHEQAERCRRLARNSIDLALRDSLLKLADEYAERAGAKDNIAVAPASSNDQSGA
jgi:hypothetical protein